MVTMRDVAREAGVSQSTVSHVLNKSRYVAPETVAAVEAAIERTGYVNNSIARTLKTGKSHTIGMAISSMSNPYFGALVQVIERHVSDRGLPLILADTHDEPVRELQVVTELLARFPDGLILAPSPQPNRALNMIQQRQVPVVLLDRLPDQTETGGLVFDSVGVTNVEPMIELVTLLASVGHRRIALLCGQAGLATTLERQQGYRKGLERSGLGHDPELEVDGYPFDERVQAEIDRILRLADRPTALITGNDQITIATMRFLQARGLRIPDDLSLAAFDDFEWADLFTPRLTAIRQPIDEIGKLTVELLFSRIEGSQDEPRRLRVSPALMTRESHLPSPLPATMLSFLVDQGDAEEAQRR